ncbi:hypothetical protein HMPREF1319_0631 [Capnocytophaga ochracea str. Holt 25]|nr:hypothetical protein HMPREF1319_0631 [Capnocytophaga ochracea str. Holt 25]
MFKTLPTYTLSQLFSPFPSLYPLFSLPLPPKSITHKSTVYWFYLF